MKTAVSDLKQLDIPGFTTLSGVTQDIQLSYQVFGLPLEYRSNSVGKSCPDRKF